MSFDKCAFERGAIRPMVCLREGWQLLGGVYWLFLGITFVGVLMAQLGPMGILMGPALCGIHLCMLRHERGLPVSFDMLFNGFQHFGQSLVVAMGLVLPMIAVLLVAYLGIAGGAIFVTINLAEQGRHGPPDFTMAIIVGIVAAVLLLAVIVFVLLLQMLFFFAFPLIVDRELSGLDAIKLSFRAALSNFGGLLSLLLLLGLLGVVAELCLCVGLFFFLPLHFAAATIAFRQVFPSSATLRSRDDAEPTDLEPKKPAIVDTGIVSA